MLLPVIFQAEVSSSVTTRVKRRGRVSRRRRRRAQHFERLAFSFFGGRLDEAWRRVGKRAHVGARLARSDSGRAPASSPTTERRDSEGGNASWVRATVRLAASLLAHGVDTRPMIFGEVRSCRLKTFSSSRCRAERPAPIFREPESSMPSE